MPEEFKLIYVAGHYRHEDPFRVEENIFRARQAGYQIALLGAMPVIPHANTAHYDALHDGQWWLDATLELMRRCDAVYLLPNWRGSNGTKGERAEALRLGLPVFEDMLDVGRWLNERA